ncbi:MAG: hypothetical protein Q9M92_11990 [Enterobacterales bacterium]|nr:hypothetical protein [Enterobacterales bacterium]
MRIMSKLLKIIVISYMVYPSFILGLLNQLPNQFEFFEPGYAYAAENRKPTTRKTPALRERIYTQLARAQKLADNGQVKEGLEVLDHVKSRLKQLNSYEKAMLWNFYAFIHYANNDTNSAIKYFARVVQQKNIPESLELSTLYSLAQLSLAAGDAQQTIKYISRWEEIKGQLNDSSLVLKANAYYLLKQYQKAESAISIAVNHVLSKDKKPKENWLVLQRALHYELKNPMAVTKISEQLVHFYPKARYWIDLANMYGETEQPKKQLAIMEAAYQQGFVTKKRDIQTLSQLYYEAGAPYKSAKLLSDSIQSGIIFANIKILHYLAQAWISAKEIKKAIPVLKRATDLSSNGNLDAKLADLYYQTRDWKRTLQAAKEAIRKGNLDNLGSLYITMGRAYVNLEQFDRAIETFALADKQGKQHKVAKQWINYTQTEKHKYQILAQLSSTDS